ncbi:MAG: hypothetical protein CFE23_05385 [Flavobacterium sp. BFFFF1]|uniref:hypothetical protein n=1 Tax=Flavobacterium sp. BFFFF1 TaxID=2015557 RepID=UPI000BD789C7|nr:hypothetical protein [Flavobacterium sp. BFFFF1]OYU81200.1 MAG: hypothetical protein CFE23_05385 [Flavobacterium sp. BFFFF1]
MKTKTLLLMIVALMVNLSRAQDVTTVNAKNSDISDNLDLRAVASLFGESANLEEFEQKLNDPKEQISNLDLNNDGKVDYLRVVESTESNTHVIIIQSVLAKDVFQDIATVEVEKDANNNVQVQVVGDVYMYGSNYIYEPVYVTRPVIYSVFWTDYYRPYYSPWYWNYYPTYYYTWEPYPVFRYRRDIDRHINVHNHYNYVNVRRSDRAVAIHNNRRANGYETIQPNRSFSQRNNNVSNRYELDKTREKAVSGRLNGADSRGNSTSTRGNESVRNSSTSVKTAAPVRSNTSVRTSAPVRSNSETAVRSNSSTRAVAPVKSENTVRTNTPQRSVSTRSNDNVVRTKSQTATPAQTTPVRIETRQNTPTRTETQTRTVQPARSSNPPARTQNSESGAKRTNGRG